MANGSSITYIDPAQGALGQSLAALGKAVANRLNERNIREKQLAKNPQTMASLAPAARRAQSAGQLDAFAASLNVRPEFVQKLIIDAYQPTTAELADQASRRYNLPELQARQVATQAGYNIDSLNAARDAGLITLEPQAKAAGAKAGVAQDTASAQYWNDYVKNGGPTLKLNADIAGLKEQAQAIGLKSDAIDQYTSFINRIDKSTPEGRRVALMTSSYMANPGFANWLAQIDSESFQMKLARFRAMPTMKDKIGLSIDVDKQYQAAVGNLRLLQKNKADKDVIASAMARVNSWKYNSMLLQRAGAILPTDVVGARPGIGLFGGPKGVKEYVETAKPSERVAKALEEISKDKSLEKDVPGFRATLSEREQQDLDNGLAAIQGQGSESTTNVGKELTSTSLADQQKFIQDQKDLIVTLQKKLAQLMAGTYRPETPYKSTKDIDNLIQQTKDEIQKAQDSISSTNFILTLYGNSAK